MHPVLTSLYNAVLATMHEQNTNNVTKETTLYKTLVIFAIYNVK